jgi:hypothetical protein
MTNEAAGQYKGWPRVVREMALVEINAIRINELKRTQNRLYTDKYIRPTLKVNR